MTIHHASMTLGRMRPGPIPRASSHAEFSYSKRPRSLRPSTKFISSAHGGFARVLSRNTIAWQYKPRTFAIEWDCEGNLVDSITPDFYLPDYRQYVELMTPEERCVSAKARRLRMLSHVHPGLDIHLIVGANYLSAVEHFLAAGIWPL